MKNIQVLKQWNGCHQNDFVEANAFMHKTFDCGLHIICTILSVTIELLQQKLVGHIVLLV